MRNKRKNNKGFHNTFGSLSLAFALMIMAGLFYQGFAFVSYASQAIVIKDSVKVRKEASTSSEVVGSATRDTYVTVNGQVSASDGNIWYQVTLDANTEGYIRSDLLSIGGTPSSTNTNPGQVTARPVPATEQTANVTAVNPVSATVSGAESVRIRSSASTNSSIVTFAERGVAVTIIGKADGADNHLWYQVEYTVNGSSVTGFIRSDYIDNLSEPLTELTEQPQEPVQDPAQTEPSQETTPDYTKAYETALEGEDWYLIDRNLNGQYKIKDIFDKITENGELYNGAIKQVKGLKAAIIILVIIIIILGAVITLMVFKIRDAQDALYFEEAEKKESLRRSADRPQSVKKAENNKEEVRTRQSDVRAERSERRSGQKPQKPQNGSAQTQPQKRKPSSEKKPQTSNSSDAPKRKEPDKTVKKTMPEEKAVSGKAPVPNKTKNFIADDVDEFEFEFLNWDSDEKI